MKNAPASLETATDWRKTADAARKEKVIPWRCQEKFKVQLKELEMIVCLKWKPRFYRKSAMNLNISWKAGGKIN